MSVRRSPDSLERRSSNVEQWRHQVRSDRSSDVDAGRQYTNSSAGSDRHHRKYADSGYASSNSSAGKPKASSRPPSVTPSIAAHRKLAEEHLLGIAESEPDEEWLESLRTHIQADTSSSSSRNKVPRSTASKSRKMRETPPPYTVHSDADSRSGSSHRSTYTSRYSEHAEPQIIDISPTDAYPDRYARKSRYTHRSEPLSPNIIDASPRSPGLFTGKFKPLHTPNNTISTQRLLRTAKIG